MFSAEKTVEKRECQNEKIVTFQGMQILPILHDENDLAISSLGKKVIIFLKIKHEFVACAKRGSLKNV